MHVTQETQQPKTKTTMATSSSAISLARQLAEQKSENEKLLARLQEIRSSRRQCRRDLATTHAELQAVQWNVRVRSVAHQEDALRDRISKEKRIQHLHSQLDVLQECNVEANDAFPIAVHPDTVVATINGVRLCPTVHAASNWKEVNAALGQVVLLLDHLQQHYVTDAEEETFRYRLVPAGSQSKIGIRQNNSLYTLFFAEESFHFFGRRNFNTALGYLLGYVMDLATVFQRRDRTIVQPYGIQEEGHTIGGLSIVYDGTNNEDWTRALKYLMTNIKHLLVFREIGISSARKQRVGGD